MISARRTWSWALRDQVDAPVLALTATATPRVREEIVRELRLRDPLRVLSFDRPNLAWG
jgi:ATP-dependent DNA helicase RecQ